MPGQRRIIRPINQPVSPLQGGKAGSKDPRGFVSGNVPGQQWDIQQFSADKAAAYGPGGVPKIADVQRGLGAGGGVDGVVQSMPTRTLFYQWAYDGLHPTVLQANTPFELVPKNPQRISIELSVPLSALPIRANDDVLLYSWGQPQILGGIPFGHSLAGGQVLSYQGDACPIDALFVWFLTGQSLFGWLAYEGIIAPEGNAL